MIKLLSKEHAPHVALLHIKGISTGFISSLGRKFVTALYESIAESPYGFGFVEELNGNVVGFVAFTTGLDQLYWSILKKNMLRFSLILFYKMFSWVRIKKLLETLFYPSRIKNPDTPNAELLSIVVAESERGKGVASMLIQRGLLECDERGIPKVKVLVADFNKPANDMYRKVGFEPKMQIENHGVLSNIYVVSTNRFSKNYQQ